MCLESIITYKFSISRIGHAAHLLLSESPGPGQAAEENRDQAHQSPEGQAQQGVTMHSVECQQSLLTDSRQIILNSTNNPNVFFFQD